MSSALGVLSTMMSPSSTTWLHSGCVSGHDEFFLREHHAVARGIAVGRGVDRSGAQGDALGIDLVSDRTVTQLEDRIRFDANDPLGKLRAGQDHMVGRFPRSGRIGVHDHEVPGGHGHVRGAGSATSLALSSAGRTRCGGENDVLSGGDSGALGGGGGDGSADDGPIGIDVAGGPGALILRIPTPDAGADTLGRTEARVVDCRQRHHGHLLYHRQPGRSRRAGPRAKTPTSLGDRRPLTIDP